MGALPAVTWFVLDNVCVCDAGASLLAAASPSLAAPAAFVARPICITTARPWVEEDLSIEMNVVGWQRTDTRVLSHTLDLCGLRPHDHAASSVSASDAPTRRVLDSASLAATWPDELRERVEQCGLGARTHRERERAW